MDLGVQLSADKSTIDMLSDIKGTYAETKKQGLITYSIGEGAAEATAKGLGFGLKDGEKELGLAGTLQAIGNSHKDVMTMVALAENKALREKIDGALNGDAATLGGAVNEASGIVQTLDGAKEGDISHVTLYQGSETDNEMRNYAAAYDEYNNETYLNTEETDISRGGDIMKSIFWEAQRKKNADSNIGLDSEQQYTMASLRGSQAETLWNRFSETANKNSSSTGSWNTANSGYLSSGSIKANSLVTDTGNVVPRLVESFKGEGSPYWIVEKDDKNLKNIRDKINQQYNMDVTLQDIKNANPDIENLDKIHLNDKISLSFLKIDKEYSLIGVESTYGARVFAGAEYTNCGDVLISEDKDVMNVNSGRQVKIITQELIPYTGSSKGIGGSATLGPQIYGGFGGEFLNFDDAKSTFMNLPTDVTISVGGNFSKSGTSKESGASWYMGGIGLGVGINLGNSSTNEKKPIWNFENKKMKEVL